MDAIEVVVEGALTEDGQLLLDERPNLPAGRVRVLVRPAAQDTRPGRSAFEVLEEIWAAQDARGEKGTPAAELLAELDVMRDEWDADPEEPTDGPAADGASHVHAAPEASR
jgi:hypothetical protein